MGSDCSLLIFLLFTSGKYVRKSALSSDPVYEPTNRTNKMACTPRVFAVRMKKAWVLSYPMSTQRRLIRLGGYPSWSESSLGAQSLCWFCHVAAHLPFSESRTEHSGILQFIYGPLQANLVLIACASSEGSGEPAHPRSLARTFGARSYKQWVKRNLQTESQIPRPSEWLRMRS